MNMRFSAVIAVVVLATAAACSGPARHDAVAPSAAGSSPASGLPGGTLIFGTSQGDVTMSIEIAETVQARERGLMGRTSLQPDAGMAFLFPEPYSGGFWMKDTLIPLSIAFWNGQGKIQDILEMTPCKADPCTIYVPKGGGSTGAVEASPGYFSEHGISIGDTVTLQR